MNVKRQNKKKEVDRYQEKMLHEETVVNKQEEKTVKGELRN